MKRLHIDVAGVVQGVGFRPFVHNLAVSNRLTGFVGNSSAGVVIEVEGDGVDAFVEQLRDSPPPLSEISELQTSEIPPKSDSKFKIIKSTSEEGSTFVSPDATVCKDCLRELMDPGDRRYLYPFINCTNCGPRYSITTGIPYDRPNTTMAGFVMCGKCREEYEDPANRRFHAQPNACPVCGPQVKLDFENETCGGTQALVRTIEFLKQGKIVAVKGIGGFHLAADAENAEALKELRRRKQRSNKAFALMAADVEGVRRYCRIGPEEEELLTSVERPVVLLERKSSAHSWAAPNLSSLGFMLPYAPLHYLLFHLPLAEKAAGANFNALAMTSGNMSDEPIAKSYAEAKKRLSKLADAFLIHDRPIFMRVDDSVARRASNSTVFIRRARGFAPRSIDLGTTGPEVLACGADLKNAFTMTKGRSAIVSQHLGDFENFETQLFFEETLENLKKVYRATPCCIAHDLHPDYLSTRWAMEQKSLPALGIQHHHAHIASVMAEQGLRDKVVGVAMDGTGYGPGGGVWGGEFMICGLTEFERIGRFRPITLPGGEAAIKNPWMTAVGIVQDIYKEKALEQLDALGYCNLRGAGEIENILKLGKEKIFSPQTSSAGRLFDVASSLLGFCHSNTYESEAAIVLEGSVAGGVSDAYPYFISSSKPFIVDFSETIYFMVEDLKRMKNKGYMAAKFHNTVIRAIAEATAKICSSSGIRTAALSGGVFQNAYILEGLCLELDKSGVNPIFNAKVPCNDGGVSLGQAYILREKLKRGDLP